MTGAAVEISRPRQEKTGTEACETKILTSKDLLRLYYWLFLAAFNIFQNLSDVVELFAILLQLGIVDVGIVISQLRHQIRSASGVIVVIVPEGICRTVSLCHRDCLP